MDAGEWNDTLDIENLTAFDFAVFSFMIRIGKELANRSEARTTMGLVDCFDRIKAVPARPP